MPTKHVYDPAIPLMCLYEPGTGESVKPTLKVMDDDGVKQSTKTRVPIIHSEAKGDIFSPLYLHVITLVRTVLEQEWGTYAPLQVL